MISFLKPLPLLLFTACSATFFYSLVAATTGHGSLVTNLMLALNFLVGGPLGGILSDKFGVGRARVLFSYLIVSLLSCAVGAGAGTASPSLTLVCLAVGILANGMSLSCLSALIDEYQDNVAPQFFWGASQLGSFLGLVSYGRGFFSFSADPSVFFGSLAAVLGIAFCLLLIQLKCVSISTPQTISKEPLINEGTATASSNKVSWRELLWLLLLLTPISVFYATFFNIFSNFEQTSRSLTNMRLGNFTLSSTATAAVQPLMEIIIISVSTCFNWLCCSKPSTTVSSQGQRNNRRTLVVCAVFMEVGLLFAALAAAYGASIEALVPHTSKAPYAVVLPMYIYVSLAEVLFLTNALKFVALLFPPSSQSAIQSLVWAQIGIGALLLLVIQQLTKNWKPFDFYLLTTALMVVVMVLFIFILRRTISIKAQVSRR